MARSRDSTLGRRGRRYSSSVQSRLDGSVCMMIEPPQEPWTKITSQIACLRRPVYVRLAYTACAVSCRNHRRPDMWPVVAYMRVAPSQCRMCGTSSVCTGTASGRTRRRRPAEAFALRLLALKRKEMRPALNPALPSLRVSTPRSSYHYTQRLYTTCIFAQVMTQHAHSSELFSDVCLSVLTASIKSGI
jgi:hypothetical protein